MGARSKLMTDQELHVSHAVGRSAERDSSVTRDETLPAGCRTNGPRLYRAPHGLSQPFERPVTRYNTGVTLSGRTEDSRAM
jgi:hypothetical protein